MDERKRELTVVVVMLVLWMVAASSVFHSELEALKALPAVYSMSAEEREVVLASPIAALAEKAAAITPRDAKVLLVVPPEGPNGYFAGKVKYYLYPRMVIVAASAADFVAVKENDYIVMYLPGHFYDPLIEGAVGGIIYKTRVYDFIDSGGRQMIFRVDRQG